MQFEIRGKGMKRSLWIFFLITLLSGSPLTSALSKETMLLYTSMKEPLIVKLRDAFAKKCPDIDFDFYSAGAGKLMAKIAIERQSGKIMTDVLWTGEILDFYQLKGQGVLEKYASPESKSIVTPVKDPEGFFTPVRLGTLGIAYNTRKVAVPPKSWRDMLDSRFKDGFEIANPALSGTACVSVAMIACTMGWDYIERLKANGAMMGRGSGQVVNDTASGDSKATIAVDYITVQKMEKGAHLGLIYPKEMLVIPSPVAILKGTSNLKAAQRFVDFLLTREGQEIIASMGTLPVREDVPLLKGYNLVSPREAEKRAMKVDYPKILKEKEEIIQKFSTIMRGK
jgi:iron(III) transport system substrate-binding protein